MGGCGRAPAGDVSQLNAINAGVVGRLHELYAQWDAHPHVHAILIKGAGGKAFCAGGDGKAAVAGAFPAVARQVDGNRDKDLVWADIDKFLSK